MILKGHITQEATALVTFGKLDGDIDKNSLYSLNYSALSFEETDWNFKTCVA